MPHSVSVGLPVQVGALARGYVCPPRFSALDRDPGLSFRSLPSLHYLYQDLYSYLEHGTTSRAYTTQTLLYLSPFPHFFRKRTPNPRPPPRDLPHVSSDTAGRIKMGCSIFNTIQRSRCIVAIGRPSLLQYLYELRCASRGTCRAYTGWGECSWTSNQLPPLTISFVLHRLV
ncbi:hypothetical protein EDB89DRAFT_322655 [Lactarius sanguifluus]|nr:hypothetical protein EDB89DRAFT_322655 [Lactarius sanguifluus]